LRGPLYPDPLADEGLHHFTYSVLPHAGDWTSAGVVAEAFALNSPLIAAPAGANASDGAGFVQAAGTELALGALKPAEDGNGIILRVYEPHGNHGPVTLRFADPVSSVERVNLLEEPADDSQPQLADGGATARFNVRSFEVVTLRIV
jgi:alpha-mannosidase